LTAQPGTLDFESLAFKVAYSWVVAAIVLAAESPLLVATGSLAIPSATKWLIADRPIAPILRPDRIAAPEVA